MLSTRYLLQQDDHGREEVLAYGHDECAELFTTKQLQALDRGEVVLHRWYYTPRLFADVRLVDMRLAARAVARGG